MIHLKRAYAAASPEDGTRILVDRVWPRGVTKQRAQLDLWLKDVGPSSELWKSFGHDPAKWEEFEARYRQELTKASAPVALLREKAARGTITLIYSTRDEQHNGAVVLRQFLER